MFGLFRKKVKKHASPSSRKERSENRLADLGISYNSELPETIESDSAENVRDAQEIAKRLIGLWEIVNIASKFKGASRKESTKFLQSINVWDTLSLKEQQFLMTSRHSKQRITDLRWQMEVIKVLYWAINEIPALGKPIEDLTLVDVSENTVKKFPSLESFLTTVERRSATEILDEADFMYRLHWCARSHRRKEQGVPGKYNYSVILERDFALRWLTNPKKHWDEISLDT